MAKRDYYEILGVARDADAEAMKRAFRKEAMKCHPDRNPNNKEAEQKFKELNEAYDVLKDDQKRAAYDRFGHAAFEGGMGGAGARGFDFTSTFADVFDDLFGEFMGGRRGGGQSATRGADLRYNLEISLEDAFKGSSAKIRVPTSVTCETCNGSGAAGDAKPKPCGTCHGHGKIRAQQGFFTIERSCPTCGGVGRVIENPCRVCSGAGRVHKEKTLAVNVPAGVEDGTRIRLGGEGEAGLRGGPPGDLYIFLAIAPHRFFRREGLNVYCRAPISMVTAALGGNIEVPTLDGSRAKVAVAAGTQTGQQFRLKGKGMPVMRGHGHGDMFVQVMVETPVKLSKRQKELLEEFQKAGSKENQPESEGFFAKVKEFWDDLRE
ncbi:molecular chaperone DnaJ [Desertibaculum subflavum]|uniref:molecular chaperone DnaJ n=1 Tax=Desertibaculum subflavum TaxID=2268458 RepID=UPI000E661116